MENLEILTEHSHEIKLCDNEEILHTSFCDDCTSVLLTNENNVVFHDSSAKSQTTWLPKEIKDITHIQRFNLTKSLLIIEGANILLYDYDDNIYEALCSVDSKILNVAWNPNGNFFVAIDDKHNLYGFNFDENFRYETLAASFTSNLNSKVPNSVYVGWGSHNTQFKGSKKQEETVEEIVQSYKVPLISWRGNSEEFVVNFWREGKRYLKVFDRTLRPLYETDVYFNLLRPTSFKGQGNCIACVAVHNDRNKIIIFEKNCLVKSEFFVPENKGNIKHILYHPVNNILGIYSMDDEGYGYLNIYHNSNAKWYLKQQLFFTPDNKLINFSWIPYDVNNVIKLAVITTKEFKFYDFRFTINRSTLLPLVAVIDGVNVNFTFFDSHIIPPPLAGTVMTFSNPVNRVLFHPSLKLCLIIDSRNINIGINYDNHKLLLVSDGVEDVWPQEVLEDVLSHKLIFSDTNETKMSLDISKQELSHLYYCTGISINNEFYVFALSHNNRLYVNDVEVCSDVISIFIYQDYLIFTHYLSKLFCIRLLPEYLDGHKWDLNKIYSREIEQGSKIVCMADDGVVLQVPRGNLETITCRLISIDHIEKLLNENKWHIAIAKIRLERLNWNLLIDLNPQRILENIDEFIKAASTASLLNTIVSEFNDTNCLKTLYSQSMSKNYLFSTQDKKKIFESILYRICETDPISNLISIVTIQIKLFSLKSALSSVCHVYELSNIDICKKAMHQILLYKHANDVIAVSHTLYNINFVSFVYGCCAEDPKVYEPEIEKLRKLDDVHLRFQMSCIGKQFDTSTKYLIRCKNFDESFISNFITKHNTQNVAYCHCPKSSPNFKIVSQLMAKKISARGEYYEAGLILYRCGDLESALEQFVKSANRSKVASLTRELNIDPEKRDDIFNELAENLAKLKLVDEAARCYHDELHDVEKSINVWLEHQRFQSAVSLANQYGNKNLIENTIKPELMNYKQSINDRIDELLGKIRQSSERLEIVRNTKFSNLVNPNIEYDHNVEDDLYSESGSTMSLRSSSGSSRTRGSTLSSRNRRKEAKKKINLREGGFYEDIALIRQLYSLIVEIFSLGQDVKEVCQTFMVFEEGQRGSYNLYKKLSQAQEETKSYIPKIWSDVFLNATPSSEPSILSIIQNKDDLEEKYRIPPKEDTLNMEEWKLSWFE